uniref:Uncharacterized protein n=1 Tax=candidate division WOR-3 bacterium TaxID=2052148 RepID=A0A7V3NVK1_UNCW3
MLIFYEVHPYWRAEEEPFPELPSSFEKLAQLLQELGVEPQEKAGGMEFASLPKEEQEKRMHLLEWEGIEPEIKEIWDRLKRKVEEVMSGLDPKKVKLYRDSSFYSGDWPEYANKIRGEYFEMKEDAEKGKLEPAFEYLLKILPPENFVGPEDPMLIQGDLLEDKLKELKEKVTGENLALVESISKILSRLMIRARDISMANTINRTLQEGETGLLFVGLDHEPQRFLASDIKHEIVFGREEWPEEYRKKVDFG